MVNGKLALKGMKFAVAVAFCAFLASPAMALNMEAAGIGAPSKAPAADGKPSPSDGSAPQAAESGKSGCNDDDPRLLTINEWAGKGPQQPPVCMSPRFFLELDPQIRARLGNREVMVSPNIGIGAGGLPNKKIRVPFPDLLAALGDACSEQNVAAAKFLMHSFMAEPMDPRQVALLGSQGLGWQEENAIKIFNALGLEYKRKHNALFFFVAFGGRAKERLQVCSSLIASDCERKYPDAIYVGKIDDATIMGLFDAAGLTAVNPNN